MPDRQIFNTVSSGTRESGGINDQFINLTDLNKYLRHFLKNNSDSFVWLDRPTDEQTN